MSLVEGQVLGLGLGLGGQVLGLGLEGCGLDSKSGRLWGPKSVQSGNGLPLIALRCLVLMLNYYRP